MIRLAVVVDMNRVVGRCDLLLMTLDTLRYDVAMDALAAGQTPHLAAHLPGGTWELRHAPASFTLPAHQAIFAGFLPTPAQPGRHERLLALRFAGSETTGPRTCVLDGPDIVRGLAARGYHTVCIGGVGFFNGQTPLGRVLPGLFADAHWDASLGVTEPRSTARQVALAVRLIEALAPETRLFLFVNISALHQPNYFYAPGRRPEDGDDRTTQAAALAYVDSQLPPLFAALRARADTFCVVCADHGTAYGEGGFSGHRLAHPVVWNVPYAHFLLEAR